MAQTAKAASESRRGLVNVRMAAEDRNIIDRAAKVAGKTRTEFMVDAARRAAQETLLDSSLIVVDGKTFDRFRKIFDAPAKPNERLQKLMNLKAPWES
ncbi:DUF1778 domain-containing protein [Methylocystis sp. WRRC1]|uniref:type II toxin-antitoxin system TacA family antitoxin n=1 Tax=Methylocystis sp. WRRC1 TaxID=1732014 RepID=UPI001D147772|nr:DUF1778 domain-containing protein [Methylocystis sp. WRRC1]MCC3244623.1 DUF1778 domain-containing protein [Methylocystis sp. WRRC1]